MSRYKRGDDREELLADVAEMYYDENLTQAEIADAIGFTRSAISRMLTEAREKGIVDIKVRRPLRFDASLEQALINNFGLQDAHVLIQQKVKDYDQLRQLLGKAAARVLTSLLRPYMTIGVAWGTTVGATVDELEIPEPIDIKAVQLVGVLGSDSHAFNAQALVENVARKAGGRGIYLYTPFIVESEDLAQALMNNQSVRESIAIGKQCDVTLLGVGTVVPEFCSLYQGGHISLEELSDLQTQGAVGDVCGLHFDIHGNKCDLDFHKRLVGIASEDLKAIPTRLAVAGQVMKAPAILGALRGNYVNVLVTDNQTAYRVLELAEEV